MCEFSSDQVEPAPPCIGRQNLNNWMITEVPTTFLVYDMLVSPEFDATETQSEIICLFSVSFSV